MDSIKEYLRYFTIIFAVGFAGVEGYDLSMTQGNSNQAQQNESTIETNQAKIYQNAADIVALKTILQINSHNMPVETKVSASICTCIAKDDSKEPHIQLCKAKNATCDKESRGICEKMYTGYEC